MTACPTCAHYAAAAPRCQQVAVQGVRHYVPEYWAIGRSLALREMPGDPYYRACLEWAADCKIVAATLKSA